MSGWTVLLRPFEQEMLTKTKGFDEAIALDDVRAPWLGRALGEVATRRRQSLAAQGLTKEEVDASPLWTFKSATVLAQFREAADRLGVRWLTNTLYVLRHGGASRDVLMRLRPLEEVTRRGRWAQLSSIKHYEKHGRTQWILHRVGQALVQRGHELRASFSTQFRK